jgi:hypothetical protein
MSYTEYMRNKKQAMQVILDTKKPTDASLFISKKRMQASADFQYDGSYLGVSGCTTNLSRTDGVTGITSIPKQTGRPKDASDYTSYRGSQGIGNDSAYRRGIIVQQCSSNCIPTILPADKSASTITSEIKACHTEAQGTPKFTDNTIRLVGANIADPIRVTANHSNKDILCVNRHPSYNGKFKGQPYYPAPIQSTSQGFRILPGTSNCGVSYTPVKVGQAITHIKSGYIENKHGNDISVNPKRIPIKYIPTAGIEQLKINKPTLFNIKGVNE